jgi:hypothetical protein
VGGQKHARPHRGDRNVELEKGLKPVLKLSGQEKRLVVNATNYDALADAFGSNPSKWAGHTIELKGEKVLFKGRRIDSIRVSVPKLQPKQETIDGGLDDEIPDFPAQ